MADAIGVYDAVGWALASDIPTSEAEHEAAISTPMASEVEVSNQFGTHSGQANVHHDSTNDPSADEKAALVGTTGAPAAGNRFVTETDPVTTNARTPTAHAHAHAATTGKTATDHHDNTNDPTVDEKNALAGTGAPDASNPYATKNTTDVLQKQTHVATSAPTADHDSADTAGIGIHFRAGDAWLDTTGPTWYDCEDATPTAAVWTARSSGITIDDVDKGHNGKLILDTVGYGGTPNKLITGFAPTFPAGSMDARFSAEVPNANHPVDLSVAGELRWTVTAAGTCKWEPGTYTAPYYHFRMPFLGDWIMQAHVRVDLDGHGDPNVNNNLGGAIGIVDASTPASNVHTIGYNRNGAGGWVRTIDVAVTNNYGAGGTSGQHWIGLLKLGDAMFWLEDWRAVSSIPSLRTHVWAEKKSRDPLQIQQKNFEFIIHPWSAGPPHYGIVAFTNLVITPI